jgi:glycosyltransferase involved in cell wall biosynthesis
MTAAARTATALSERIAIVAPTAEAVAVLRHGLIAELGRRGHRVLCITPPGLAKYTRILRGLGAQHRLIELPAPSFRIFVDWQLMAGLVEQLKDWQPNIVLGSGLRMMMLTALAARRAGVRRVVSLVNGLPQDGIESVKSRRFAHAMRASDAVVFHNGENARYLEALGLLPSETETVVVPGSGVDLRHFSAKPMPPTDGGLVFLMLSRLERRRGVVEFAAAARMAKQRFPDARFQIAGGPGTEADAVSPESLLDTGAIEYLGHLDDVRPALSACHVFVYPSYAEGMPRAVLEALATGRPVITTNVPGCAETVDEMVSGCLVPPADAEALSTAMESYLRRPELLATGSRAARLKAERRFNEKQVNAVLLRVLGLA